MKDKKRGRGHSGAWSLDDTEDGRSFPFLIVIIASAGVGRSIQESPFIPEHVLQIVYEEVSEWQPILLRR